MVHIQVGSFFMEITENINILTYIRIKICFFLFEGFIFASYQVQAETSTNFLLIPRLRHLAILSLSK